MKTIINYSDIGEMKDTIGLVTIEVLECQSSEVLRLLAGRLDALRDNIRSEQQRRTAKELEAAS
jgi:hypothetical protein